MKEQRNCNVQIGLTWAMTVQLYLEQKKPEASQVFLAFLEHQSGYHWQQFFLQDLSLIKTTTNRGVILG